MFEGHYTLKAPQTAHVGVQQRRKTTAEVSLKWLRNQPHEGVWKRPWSLSYSCVTNTLDCWLRRFLSDLCPFTYSLSLLVSLSFHLSIFLLPRPAPPTHTHTRVDHTSVTDLGYLRRNLKLPFLALSLSLSFNQDNVTHVTRRGQLTYLLALQDSHAGCCKLNGQMSILAWSHSLYSRMWPINTFTCFTLTVAKILH